MRKQGGKRFLAVMLVVAAAMTQVLSVNASTMSKAKDAKKAAESDLNKANSQIETIEKQQQALQSEINASRGRTDRSRSVCVHEKEDTVYV